MRSFLLVTVLTAFAFVSPSIAAEEKPVVEKAPETTEAKTVSAKDNPVTKWRDAENALIDPLGDKDKESIFILSNKYSFIRVTEIVEQEVGMGVKSCGKNNADMKEKMDARFEQWKKAVMPIIPVAQKQLDKEVDTQNIVDTKKLREVFKLHDKAYEYSQKQTTKTPVSTKEACEDLLASMDRTEDNMVGMLKQTLLTESVIRKRGDDIKKAEKQAKDKEFSKNPAAKTETKAQ